MAVEGHRIDLRVEAVQQLEHHHIAVVGCREDADARVGAMLQEALGQRLIVGLPSDQQPEGGAAVLAVLGIDRDPGPQQEAFI